MKTLKNLFSLFMLILISAFSYAQEPSAIFISNTQDIQNANELYTDFDGAITATTWDRDYVLIEMEIEANNVSLGVAKYLVSQERFCLKMRQLDSRTMVLSMPKCKHEVYINGQRLIEQISYQVFLPKGVILNVKSADRLLPCPPDRKPLANLTGERETVKTTFEEEKNKASL